MKETDKNKPIYIADVTCNAIWKKIHGTYSSSDAIYIGKIKIAEYSFNGMRAKGDPKQYTVSSSWFSIKEEYTNWATNSY